ncbi:MAG TPA: 5'-3' exonuclease H3TH domain-containing protein [Polyangiaceae bacterium]|nr:5'-3' exonuclease H3TH domain-containing protein [Polyangiaceae bacterium]
MNPGRAQTLLLDTYSLFFRAFHALPPMSTRAGEPTSALYGLSSLLLKLMRERPGAALAFALDAPQATFRHQTFAAYKAGRPATPSSLSAQFDRLQQLIDALSVPAFRCPGFEADDVLATLAKRARASGVSALVVSGDRDLLQLAREPVRVYFAGRRSKDAVIYDEAAVTARFGVAPECLPAYVSLLGDPSDNLPGVPGIGAVSAKKLLAGKHSCRELFADLESVESARLREVLLTHREQILNTEALARLRDDAPIAEHSPGWSVPSRDSLNALGQLFEQLEFKSLSSRLAALRG